MAPKKGKKKRKKRRKEAKEKEKAFPTQPPPGVMRNGCATS